MKEQALDFARRGWDSFRAFSPGQKAVTVLATIALLIGGFLFMSWKSKPTYAPLYSNLAAQDASAIVDKLNAQKVPYQLAAGGTEILVPKDKVYATRLTMSSAGLPGSGQSGYSLLDKEGVTTSEFKQQVDYQRAIEGELAKTIQAINGVQAASVHLAIPKQDVFNDGTQKTTAAVMLTTAGGTQLTPAQVQSIVYLVSSSVPNMDTGDVTVTDASGRVLAAPGDDLSGLAGNDAQAQMTKDYNDRLSSNLEAMINAAIGAGHSVVTVNADLDFDKTSTTKNSYTYDKNAPPLSEQENTEKYSGGAGAGGPLGAGTPAVNPTPTTGGSYAKTSKTVNNALGTVTETTQNAPGAVKKLNIAVLLDQSAKNLDVAAIEELVKSAVGLDAARGDSLAIKAMPFDQSGQQAADAAAKVAAKAAADKAAHERMMSLIKQGILAGVLIVILLGTWLASRRRKRQDDAPPPPVDEDFFGDRQDQFRPLHDPREEEYGGAVVSEIEEARARRKALVALADEQPDDVARVLSGWLNSREG
jgi:flagellar M-ring protein FliF